MSNTIIINGNSLAIPDQLLDLRLLEYLREQLHLTGTKNGCGIGVCGSCTVLVGTEARRACKLTLRQLTGATITTIEGLSGVDGKLHPLQQAFLDAGAIQCGFRTPGMVLTAHALLLKNNQPTREEVLRALHGNICRCTGYQQIADAVLSAAKHYRQDPGALPATPTQLAL